MRVCVWVCILCICAHTHKEGREFILVESGDTELRTKFVIYMHIFMHIYTCIHPRTPTRVYVCVCMFVRVCVCMYTYTRGPELLLVKWLETHTVPSKFLMYRHMHIYTCIHIYGHTHVYRRAGIATC